MYWRFFTARQRSWGKVMFSVVSVCQSVCLSTGEADSHVTNTWTIQFCLFLDLPRPLSPSPHCTGTPPPQPHVLPRDRLESRQLTFDWKAFLCFLSWMLYTDIITVMNSGYSLFSTFLPPANEVLGKEILSEACVKNSVHRGVCLDACWDTTHCPTRQAPTFPGTRQAPPRDQAPAPWDQAPPPGAEHAGRYGQRAGSMHPTGMQSFFSSDNETSFDVKMNCVIRILKGVNSDGVTANLFLRLLQVHVALRLNLWFFITCIRSLWEGNVFSRICLSVILYVHRRGSHMISLVGPLVPPPQVHPHHKYTLLESRPQTCSNLLTM